VSPKEYTREVNRAICHPYPKGAADSSEFCGVARIEGVGLYWVRLKLFWSDHYPDRVLYVSVKLSPKGS
jgi:hypothetical protein